MSVYKKDTLAKECTALLHIANKESHKEKERAHVSSALVNMDKEDGWKDTGAGKPEGTLSVIPVKVKTEKDYNIITTYAFVQVELLLFFCTETVLQQLQVTGRKVGILLRTMNNEEFAKPFVAHEVA